MAIHAFAVVAPGLSPSSSVNLRALGITELSPDHGGVAFEATDAALASALVALRVASRVLVRVKVSFARRALRNLSSAPTPFRGQRGWRRVPACAFA